MLYLCAYYEPDYPDDLLPVKQSFYGKYQCGGGIELDVFDLVDKDELKGTELLWIVPYIDQKYVYVFTFFDRKQNSKCKELLAEIKDEFTIHDIGYACVILSDTKI